MNLIRKKNVLIIEDDTNTADLVALYLQREGFQALTANDGEQGLALAERYRPDLVVLDLMLPKVDGWEVCRRLRQLSDVPVIMLTARDEEIDRVAGLTLGADDYVVKPFSPRELVARVIAVLRRARPYEDSPGKVQHQGDVLLNLEKRNKLFSQKNSKACLDDHLTVANWTSFNGRPCHSEVPALSSVGYSSGLQQFC